MPVGATAKEVKSKSGGEGEGGTKLTKDPGIGSSWPDAALNPLTCPVKLSTKNHSFAPAGTGIAPEPPPLHADSKNATAAATRLIPISPRKAWWPMLGRVLTRLLALRELRFMIPPHESHYLSISCLSILRSRDQGKPGDLVILGAATSSCCYLELS